MARDQFLITRGLEADIPSLALAEPAFTTDEENFYLGGVSGKVKINNKEFQSFSAFDVPKSWGLDSIVNDGSIADANRAQDLMNYAITNGFTLFFPSGTYQWAKGFEFTTAYGTNKGRIVGQGSPYGLTNGVVFNFNQIDDTDCVKCNGFGVNLENIEIIANASCGVGLNLIGVGGSFQMVNIFIRSFSSSSVGFKMKNIFTATFQNIKVEKYDDSTIADISNCANLTFLHTDFNNDSAKNNDCLTIDGCNALSFFGVNINGQKAVKITESRVINMYGYAECVTLNLTQTQYCVLMGEQTINCDIHINSEMPVVDYGSNNHWKNSIFTNDFIPINPKLMPRNNKNSCGDEEALQSGLIFGTVSGAVIDDKPSLFSGKSYKVTVPTGNSVFRITPSNAYQSNGHRAYGLVEGDEVLYQVSLYTEFDLSLPYDANGLGVRLRYTGAIGGDIYNKPVAIHKDKWTTYQYSMKYSGTSNTSSQEIEFQNNTGAPLEIWVGDKIYTKYKETLTSKMNSIPTIGTFVKGMVFNKSSEIGGFYCTKSGTFGTLSTGATFDIVASSATITKVTGDLNDFALGDFIEVQFGTASFQTRQIMEIDVVGGTIRIDQAPSVTENAVVVDFSSPTFTEV